MTFEEVKKRVYSTMFPGMLGAFVEMKGYKFVLENS